MFYYLKWHQLHNNSLEKRKYNIPLAGFPVLNSYCWSKKKDINNLNFMLILNSPRYK